MDYIGSQACVDRLEELKNEQAQAHNMISRGEFLPLTNQLREALANIAQEVQRALNDDAVFTEDDVAMLCAHEAKKALEGKQNANKDANNYAFTLFDLSCLWLSKTETCH